MSLFNTLALELLSTFLVVVPPTQLYVDATGAGTSIVDGSYYADGTSNGYEVYRHNLKPDIVIDWVDDQWQIRNTGTATPGVYYFNNDECGSDPPVAKWEVGEIGTGPVPSLDGNVCDNLAAELVSFVAFIDEQNVRLEWSTISETDNYGFEIQQAIDHIARRKRESWLDIGFVEGHGSTVQTHHYQYSIENLSPGRHYFRLKQIDYDGSIEFSNDLEIQVEAPEGYYISDPYPNPFNPRTSFDVMVSKRQHVQVTIYDIAGHPVAILHEGEMAPGITYYKIVDGTRLSSGSYVIRVEGEHFVTNRSIVLSK